MIRKLLDRIVPNLDSARIQASWKRYQTLYHGGLPDHSPIIMTIHDFFLAEEDVLAKIRSPQEALRQSLVFLLAHLNIGDDFLPSVQFDFGPGTIPSVFGITIDTENREANLSLGSPCLKTVEEMLHLQIPKVSDGLLGRTWEFLDYFKKNIPKEILISAINLDGPLNTAYALRGNELFTDFYDYPKAVHHLFTIITDFFIAVDKYQREFYGSQFVCRPCFPFGTAIAECSTQSISSEIYREFVLPYDLRIQKELGELWIHTCGRHAHFIKEITAAANVCCLEFNEPNQFGQDFGGLTTSDVLAIVDPIRVVLIKQKALPFGKQKTFMRDDIRMEPRMVFSYNPLLNCPHHLWNRMVYKDSGRIVQTFREIWKETVY